MSLKKCVKSGVIVAGLTELLLVYFIHHIYEALFIYNAWWELFGVPFVLYFAGWSISKWIRWLTGEEGEKKWN